MWNSWAPPLPGAAAQVPAAPTAFPAQPQYTDAQYAAMTPEQQIALQQHWQQWQKYQEEYAKWHAQYGEQYNREIAAATVPSAPAAQPSTTAAYNTFYQQQPPPPPPDNSAQQPQQPQAPSASTALPAAKISGQPQMYVQQAPPLPAVQNQMPTIQPPLPAASSQQQNVQQPPSQQQQPQQQQQQQFMNFNQPPPNFNPQRMPPQNFNEMPPGQRSQPDQRSNNDAFNHDGNRNPAPFGSGQNSNSMNTSNNSGRGQFPSSNNQREDDWNPRQNERNQQQWNNFGGPQNQRNNSGPNQGNRGNFENENQRWNNDRSNDGGPNSGRDDNRWNNNRWGTNSGRNDDRNDSDRNFNQRERGPWSNSDNGPSNNYRNEQWQGNRRGNDGNFPQNNNDFGNRWNQNNNNSQNNNFNNSNQGNFGLRGSGPPPMGQGNNMQNQRSGGGELDEESFDRQFRQWEQQFEDWKRANINHPDRAMYERYKEGFETQRRRIMERREQMRRRKMEQMGGQSAVAAPTDSSVKENVATESNPCPSETTKAADTVVDVHENVEKGVEQSTKPSDDSNSKISKEKDMDLDSNDAKSVCSSSSKNNQNNSTDQDKSKATPQSGSAGKRKSRFGAPVDNKREKPSNETTTTEIISLDDDEEDAVTIVANAKEPPSEGMSILFKKSDGIPGLDLVGENPTNIEEKSNVAAVEEAKNVTKKIPSLFDIVVEKPENQEGTPAEVLVNQSQSSELLAANIGTTVADTLPNITNALKDPDFMKKISEAIAKAQARDPGDLKNTSNAETAASTNHDADVEEAKSKGLSFVEWQRKKAEAAGEANADKANEVGPNISLDNNAGSNDGNFGDVGGNRFGPNSDQGNFGGPNPNWRNNDNFGGNNQNFSGGPNDGGRFGSDNAPNRNFGGPNGFQGNRFGPNCGPNNNRFGPNGPNFGGGGGPQGPWDMNDGPNFGNGPNGPNNNNRFGPNMGQNFGPNNNRFGPNNNPNFGGPNNNRFGPNDGSNFNNGPNGPNNNNNNFGNGPNGPNTNNFGNGPNGPNNNNNFGNRFGPNFNGPNRFGRNDGPNFGDRFGPNNGPNFGGQNRNFGGGPNNRNDGRFGGNNRGRNAETNNPNNRSFDGENQNSQQQQQQQGDGKDSNVEEENSNVRNANNPFRRSGGPEAPNFDDTDVRNNAKPSWMSGPASNAGYDDFYRPMQVIDYQNTSIAPKVFDYGHQKSAFAGEVLNSGVGGEFFDEFMPVKTFDYGHASNRRNPYGSQNLNQNKRNKKNNRNKNNKNNANVNNNNVQQQTQPAEPVASQPDENAEKNKEQTDNKSTTDAPATATADSKVDEQKLTPEKKTETDQTSTSKTDLEEISDTEDDLIPIDERDNDSPPPPPPPMYPISSNGRYQSSSTTAPSSLFPSTAAANRNITKTSATHLQMSIPTIENKNTINVDEILLNPGRLSRPKRICIVLRGPPGSGKSHMARLIKEKETEMGGANPRILSIDDYFLIENDYVEKCKKTGKSIPKKEILYEYEKDMEETYIQYLIKQFKKTIADNLYDFIIIDCNNNSLRTLNEFYCHSKDSGFTPYIVDLHCDFETCCSRNIHNRTEKDIKEILDSWKPTPLHYIKLDVASLLENLVEMEDAEDMVTEKICSDEEAYSDEDVSQTKNAGSAVQTEKVGDEDSNEADDAATNCGFLKSKWENDTTTDNLARLDGTSKLMTKRKTTTMEDYLQMDDWEPPKASKDGKKRVRWADIEEKRAQEKMRAIGFVVGQTDWKRMMDPNAGNRALNQTKFIERVNKRQPKVKKL